MDGEKFEYIVEDGYAMECESCGSVAPLRTTEHLNITVEPREWHICEFCSGSFAGNASDFNHYEHAALYATIAQVANILMDNLTDRRTILKEQHPELKED